MIPPAIYIVDDDPAVRDSLSLLLDGEDCPVQCFASAEAFLEAFQPGMTGCLILDVRMKGMSGLELHEVLARRACRLSVIFLTGHGDIPMTVRAIKGGAEDFLVKPVPGEVLLERVRAALRRNAELAARSAEIARRGECLSLLTQREREILLLALAGENNKTIAQKLNISHRTVEVHRSHILQKTGKDNMLELAEYAALLRSGGCSGV